MARSRKKHTHFARNTGSCAIYALNKNTLLIGILLLLLRIFLLIDDSVCACVCVYQAREQAHAESTNTWMLRREPPASTTIHSESHTNTQNLCVGVHFLSLSNFEGIFSFFFILGVVVSNANNESIIKYIMRGKKTYFRSHPYSQRPYLQPKQRCEIELLWFWYPSVYGMENEIRTRKKKRFASQHESPPSTSIAHPAFM